MFILTMGTGGHHYSKSRESIERTSDEHHWFSNVTFSAVHVSTTVPCLVLFLTPETLLESSTHSGQHNSSTISSLGK